MYSIQVFFKDGSKQVIHPKTESNNDTHFKGDAIKLAKDLFGAHRILRVETN